MKNVSSAPGGLVRYLQANPTLSSDVVSHAREQINQLSDTVALALDGGQGASRAGAAAAMRELSQGLQMLAERSDAARRPFDEKFKATVDQLELRGPQQLPVDRPELPADLDTGGKVSLRLPKGAKADRITGATLRFGQEYPQSTYSTGPNHIIGVAYPSIRQIADRTAELAPKVEQWLTGDSPATNQQGLTRELGNLRLFYQGLMTRTGYTTTIYGVRSVQEDVSYRPHPHLQPGQERTEPVSFDRSNYSQPTTTLEARRPLAKLDVPDYLVIGMYMPRPGHGGDGPHPGGFGPR